MMRRYVVLLFLGTSLFVQPAFAAWQRDYVRARSAYERGQDAEVIRLLDQVIAERPQPVVSARIESRGTDAYVPQLYLGMALQRSGNCTRALALLQDSALSAVLASLPAERSMRDAAVQRCAGASTSPVASSPPPPAQSPPAAPMPASPPPDPWLTERAKIIELVEAYASQASLTVPDDSRFQSPQARQWVLVLRALQAARQAAAAAEGSVDQSRHGSTANTALSQARALGSLPEWQSLASPRQRRFLN